MVVLKPASEWGRAPPPETPYSICSNMRGWDVGVRILQDDYSDLARITHIYPRFAPTLFAAQLSGELTAKLGLEGLGVLPFVNPVAWPFAVAHAQNKRRAEKAVKPEDLTFKCVDVGGSRLYLICMKPENAMAMGPMWGYIGLGTSVRYAEHLLKDIGTAKEVPFESIDAPPEPIAMPETDAHKGLRERVSQMMHRAAIDPDKIKCQPEDVYLYPNGMAAFFHLARAMLKYRPGWTVLVGQVYHDTRDITLEQSQYGSKHFGKGDDESLDELEAWLESEAKENHPVSFLFVEFPANPTLQVPDLPRLRKLSEKYGFVMVIDDTVSSVSNVDVLPSCDIILTSLTKSFSGYANVLAGSLTLNPLSPHYNGTGSGADGGLAKLFSSTYRNEFFSGDAEALLANSKDFLERTQILNRNALAMVKFLHAEAQKPDSPIEKVQYPTLSPRRAIYDSYLRKSTPELPEPGHGCLLTVVFKKEDLAIAFFDRCGFYPTPHLGGHVTLEFCYNFVTNGNKPEEIALMESWDVQSRGIRLSAGLEAEEDIIDTLKDALDVVKEYQKTGVKKMQGE